MQGAVEGVENEAELFQRDHAEQRDVAGLAEDDWRVSITLRQREMAFRDRPLDRTAVRQREAHTPLRLKTEVRPDVMREQRVLRSAVNQELDVHVQSGRSHHGALDRGESHAKLIGHRLQSPHPKTSSGSLVTLSLPEQLRGLPLLFLD